MRKLISLVSAILLMVALPRQAYAHHLGLSIEHDVLMLVVYSGFMLIILRGWFLLGLDPLPRARPRLGAFLRTPGPDLLRGSHGLKSSSSCPRPALSQGVH